MNDPDIVFRIYLSIPVLTPAIISIGIPPETAIISILEVLKY